MGKGKFITFEGIEACGKTTQIKLLDKYLSQKGYKTVLTREPGGTKIGDLIRSILLDTKNKNMHPKTEWLLYAAGRAQHVEELIKPSLVKGWFVLSDRYIDSTIAYQGAARRLDTETLKQLNDIATGGLKPDITIVLDITAEEGLKRAHGRGALDRFEQEELDFHKRVRNGYLELAKLEPARIKVVDGSKNVDEIHKEIVSICT